MNVGMVTLVGVGILLAGAIVIPYLADREVQSRIGPRHIYQLSEQPRFLSEELALAKARETLTLDGVDIAYWSEYGSTRQTTSNQVIFMFTNSTASTRFVRINLDGSRVVGQASIGK